MKRTLALLLAVTMFCIVPGVTDLAAYACGTDPWDWQYGYSIHMDGDGIADVLNGDYILDFGARVLGTDTITVNIPIYWEAFWFRDRATQTWIKGEDLKNAGQDWSWAIDDDAMKRMTLVFTDNTTGLIFEERHKFAYEAGNVAHFELVAERIGLAQGEVYIEYQHDDQTVTRSASVPINGRVIDPTINKSITSIADRNLSSHKVTLNNTTLYEYDDSNPSHNVLRGPEDFYLGEIPPESVMTFRLNTEFFNWDPLISAMNTTVRASTMGNNRIGVQIKIAEGYRLIDEAVIENIGGVAHVIVRFADILPYIKEKDFDFQIYLTYKGKRHAPTMIRVIGTIANEVVYIDGHDYVYMGHGMIAEVEGFSKNVHLDLGEGVSVYKNLYEGKKYYGVATDERSQNDIEIMENYPTIRRVLTLTTVNMEGGNARVRLTVPQSEEIDRDGFDPIEDVVYHVYDADGRHIGTTDELLPFREKYYLSTQPIVLTIEQEEVNILDDVEYDLEMLEEYGLTLEDLDLSADSLSNTNTQREQDFLDFEELDGDHNLRSPSGRIYR